MMINFHSFDDKNDRLFDHLKIVNFFGVKMKIISF